MESILETIRDGVGLDKADNSFDTEILLHVNSALATLNQNGIGKEVFIKGVEELWDDFKDAEQEKSNYMFEQAKLYVLLKVKLLFDPPPPSTAGYMKDAIDEILWRLRESYDLPKPREEEVEWIVYNITE